MSIESMFFERLETPIGTLTIAAAMGGLRHIEFPSNRHPVDRFDWAQGARGETADVLSATREQLQEYFAGTRRAFDLPLAPQGTAFQMDVWRLLATIPFGETWSYGDLARAIGKPEATRAVGAANGRNPLPIVLPCHRVIGADGSLTGFGGGLPIKEALLRLEGALPAQRSGGDLFG